MPDVPRCPRHDEPLTLLEEGWMNGVRRTYWGGCPGRVPNGQCRHEVRVDEAEHEEPSLFGGGDA